LSPSYPPIPFKKRKKNQNSKDKSLRPMEKTTLGGALDKYHDENLANTKK